jgi:hypothetical protein
MLAHESLKSSSCVCVSGVSDGLGPGAVQEDAARVERQRHVSKLLVMAGLTHLTAQAKPGPSIDGKASVVRPETPEHNSSRLISRGLPSSPAPRHLMMPELGSRHHTAPDGCLNGASPASNAAAPAAASAAPTPAAQLKLFATVRPRAHADVAMEPRSLLLTVELSRVLHLDLLGLGGGGGAHSGTALRRHLHCTLSLVERSEATDQLARTVRRRRGLVSLGWDWCAVPRELRARPLNALPPGWVCAGRRSHPAVWARRPRAGGGGGAAAGAARRCAREVGGSEAARDPHPRCAGGHHRSGHPTRGGARAGARGGRRGGRGSSFTTAAG